MAKMTDTEQAWKTAQKVFSDPVLLHAIRVVLDKTPTVDAVEVVRSEKCLYRSQYPDESGHYKCGGLLTEDEELLLMVKPDFFCAYGERRADEGRNSSVQSML